MGFEQLLGNDQLKTNLQNALARGHISHFYLISGSAGSGKRTLAKLLSTAILCTASTKPCMQCTACRKVMADSHPDCITVTDPEHKTVPVKMVRQIREEMFIRPNEADKKIYLFPQELGIEGQNALLKILEEPPTYGVFMLLTDNPEKLLPTVRSRGTELRLVGLSQELLEKELTKAFPDRAKEDLQAAISRSGGFLGQALEVLSQGNSVSTQTQDFADAFTQKNSLALTSALVPMERWGRDNLLQELCQWEQLLQQALICRSGMTADTKLARTLASQRSSQELLQALRQIKKAIEYIQGNVSPAAVCGYLEWALR